MQKFCYALIFCLIFPFLLSAQVSQDPSKQWVDSVFHRMTLEDKIGQLFMIAAYSNKNEAYENALEQILLKYSVGGIIFFQGEANHQAEMTNRYQKISKYPLMIGMDAEYGVGWRLENAMQFPQMLITGAITNDSLIYRLGAAIAKHCRELGVHVNFAPVADINSNPLNPVIGMRSFGESREEVTRKALMYLKGSLSENVLPVAKHFPGHGDTDTDSHLTLPVLAHTLARLDSVELYPYKKMIEDDIPAIMISHLNVKALDPSGIPASVSPLVVQDFLRNRLGYEGLCFTDAMNMKGVAQGNTPGEAEVKALLAGNDVLLFPGNLEKAIERIKKAIADSILSEEIIAAKCKKILQAKYRYVLPNLLPVTTAGLWSRLNKPEDLALKQTLYKEAITLIKNEDSLLPLTHLDTLRIASLNYNASSVNVFQTTLSRYTSIDHFHCEKNLSEDELDQWQKKLSKYNCLIVYNNTASNQPKKHFGYTNNLVRLIQKLNGKKVILCHPATPYGLEKYCNLPLQAILINYENQLYAQQYAAQAIFGGIRIDGKLPVSIDSRYPVGCSIKTRKNRLSYETPEMLGISSRHLLAIDTLCQTAIQAQATPGCQVLIAKNGSIIYNKAFGHQTYEKKIPNHISNIYDIASVTKITATLPAIMRLYDKGALHLDAPLSEYLPALSSTNKKDISLREILCHQAGLKPFLPLFTNAIDKKSLPGPLFSSVRTKNTPTKLKDRLYTNLNYHFKDSTLSNTSRTGYEFMAPGLYIFPTYRDTIRNSILNSELNPKKEYQYSDLGFILLGFTINEMTGQTLDRYCLDHFYRKLGMSYTDFIGEKRLNTKFIVPSCKDRLYRKTEIKGYVHDPTAALLGGVAGHAGLFSTAEDLAKMMQMYLDNGIYGGERFLTAETIAQFTCRNPLFSTNRRGLGFDKPETDTTKLGPTCHSAPASSFGHTGFTGTMAWCDPDNQLIYIFLSNRTYPDEFNTKLSEQNIRTRIQEIIYQALK